MFVLEKCKFSVFTSLIKLFIEICKNISRFSVGTKALSLQRRKVQQVQRRIHELQSHGICFDDFISYGQLGSNSTQCALLDVRRLILIYGV